MRTCKICNVEKPLSEFRKIRDKYHSHTCIRCKYDERNSKRNYSEEYKKWGEKYYYLNKVYIGRKLRTQEDKKAYINNYHKNRRKNDPLFRLIHSYRSLIHRSIGNKKGRNSSIVILGISYIELKYYLETKFESWMSWDNYGKYNGELNYGWDIDHIIPLSSAKNKEELIKLNHYTNLQPLCSKINRDIKINKILC